MTSTSYEMKGLEDTQATGRYFLGSSCTENAGNYTFIVYSFYPKDASQSATDRLCSSLKPQILRILAKKDAKVIPSSGKCHAAIRCGEEVGK